MNLNDLQKLVDQLQDRAGEQKALRDAFLEVGTALADILQMLEKQGPDTAKAIAAALKDIKLSMPEIKAPEFTLPAPQVTVNVPEFKFPPIKVEMPAEAKRPKLRLSITPVRAANGMATSYTITED
jgi:hypothetical protein